MTNEWTAVVCGGTAGIGLACAEALLAAGAVSVVINGRDIERAERARIQLLERYPHAQVHTVIGDASRPDMAARVMQAAADAMGRIDVLVTAAGGSPIVDFATVSPRFHEGVLALNLQGPIHFAQAIHRHMMANDEGGALVNLTSIAALRPAPQTSCYAAARAGILGLTKSLAMEWAPHIRVNAIVAGMVDWGDDGTPYGGAGARQAISEALPGKRMGAPADVAMAALYLASPMASYISGTTLELHGGGEPPLFLDIVKRHSAIRA